MENNGIIKLYTDSGKEIDCDVLFTFDSNETGNSYIAYTDNSEDDEGNLKIYASIYDKNDPKSILKPIETEKEWKVIEAILSTLQDEIKGGE